MFYGRKALETFKEVSLPLGISDAYVWFHPSTPNKISQTVLLFI